MKRIWLGVAILIVILAIGLFSAHATKVFQADVSRSLLAAGEAAKAGDWLTAKNRFFQAKDSWDRCRNRNAAITDHVPMEEIDRFFVQGEVYVAEQSRREFRACCHALSVLVEAIAEAQALNWWSLL